MTTSDFSVTTLWSRVKTGSKNGFDRTWKALDKAGTPANRLSNTLGAEAFWPATLDKECDKAARILKSFCKDGFYAEEEYQAADGPRQTQRVLQNIPASVIKNAKGLAIFTTRRTGLWLSGAGGSGVLIARKADGSWSPPSGILLHTAGLGFMVGIDIYDCVVVINTDSALEAFYNVRCTLGGEVSITAGPVGAGAVLESELHKRQAPIFTYIKSRGFHAGVQIDGTIIVERGDENERFYGQRVPVKEILEGKVGQPPFEVRRLLETLKAAQGDTHYDASALPSEPPPSDYEVDDGHVFGVPDREDPDPYGVLALEKEGMRIVEAGSQKRASWEQFSFNPSPTSPVHSVYARSSCDHDISFSRRDSWRVSTMSNGSQAAGRPDSSWFKSSTMIDSSTQTISQSEAQNLTILTWTNGLDRRSSRASTTPSYPRMRNVPENGVLDSSPVELESKTSPPSSPAAAYSTPPSTPPSEAADSPRRITSLPEAAQDAGEYPCASLTLQSRMLSPVMAKARLVDVPKRSPPKLPLRNPGRTAGMESPPSSRPSSSSEYVIAQEGQSADQLLYGLPGMEGLTIDTMAGNINLSDDERPLSKGSASSSTWDKIRALREAEDD